MAAPIETIADAIARFKAETGTEPTRVEVGLRISNALATELMAEAAYAVKTVPVGRHERRQVRSKHSYFRGMAIIHVDEPGIKVRRCAEDAIELAERPLLVVAHTDVQLRQFGQTLKLQPNEVRRVRSSDDLRGGFHGRHLFLLPDWHEGVRHRGDREVCDVAMAHAMKLFEVAEHEVLGISAEEYQARVDADRRWRASLHA